MPRFRADPEKVRVSIRRSYICANYFARVKSLETGKGIVCYDDDPEAAVNNALISAKKAGVEGIDLLMEWSYDHPQSK